MRAVPRAMLTQYGRACPCTYCRNWEGIYVMYTYAAKRQTARTIQQLLSNPESGSEDNVLRHITFCKY